MSAFVVGNAHIDVLVNAIAQYGIAGKDAGRSVYRQLGQLLWDENVRSVDHRYQQSTLPERYVLHTTEAVLDPLAVPKVIDCYQYQSCEHPAWADSDACAWVTRLREAIYAAFPGYATPVASPYSPDRLVPVYQVDAEYQRLPWPFSRLEDAVSRHAETETETRCRASVPVRPVTGEIRGCGSEVRVVS
ncbi:hypothetical protein [Nocardia carnea]|uniref:hypothetical protein n=1 Tax=Nocardia carnea TaxID=37328 RepID=UPI002454D4D0|nr:hypothetical protein [Nocardia carnea]